ncbi:MAG: rpmE [Candidatus Berkelbacteria bacterium]|nr:rpmE [Candidatus Berkelbacteria bacterium]
MKKDLHPEYYEKAKVTCSCGNTFEVGSTESEIRVEVCSACHPFYTGTAKFIDTAGRVDKFQERVKKAQEMQTNKKAKKTSKKENKEEKNERIAFGSKTPTSGS